MKNNNVLSNKEFILKRICIYTGRDIDPMSDSQVNDILKNKFNIMLPQRSSLNESLMATNNAHEIISLIIQYRTTM